MAASQNNLNISIGIDTKKLRADRAIAQEELRKLNEEMKKATRAGDVQQVQNIAAQQDTVARSVANATQQINAQTRATQGNTAATVRNAEAHVALGRASSESTKVIREQTRLVRDFGEAFGIPIRGLGAIKSGLLALGATEVVRAIKSGADALNELNNSAASFRVRPEALRQAREGVRQIGQDAKAADDIISTLSKNWEEAILKQRERGGVAGVTVFQGGRGTGPGVAIPAEGGGGRLLSPGGFNLAQLSGQVARGGQPPGIGDINKMIDAAGGIFPFALGRQPDIKKQDQEWQELARTILRVKDATVQNALSLKAYGQTFETAFGTAQRPGLERQRAGGTLPQQRGISPEDAKALADFNKALSDLMTTLDKLRESATVLGPVTTFFNDLTKGIDDSVRQVKTLIYWLQYAQGLISKAATAVSTTLSTSFPGDPGGIPAMPAGQAAGRPSPSGAPTPTPTQTPPPSRAPTQTPPPSPAPAAAPSDGATGGLESDEEYYRRTGYHYGPRTGRNAVPSGPAVGKPYGVPATSPEDLRKRSIDTNRIPNAEQDAEYFARTGHHYYEGAWSEDRALGGRALYPSAQERIISQPGGYVPPARYAAPPGTYGAGAYMPGGGATGGPVTVDSVTISTNQPVKIDGAQPPVTSDVPDISKTTTAIVDGAKQTNDALNSLSETLNSTAGQIRDAATQIGQASSSALDAANQIGQASSSALDTGAIDGQAAGGLIRGPGSSTSDSILARLSAGEYVINAASVRLLGTGFLNALNGFRLGGFVGETPMRFAAGGMVPSASGQPVHLHLGGHEYITSASPAVAAALTVEAARQQMRSAGTKPSWYGR